MVLMLAEGNCSIWRCWWSPYCRARDLLTGDITKFEVVVLECDIYRFDEGLAWVMELASVGAEVCQEHLDGWTLLVSK